MDGSGITVTVEVPGAPPGDQTPVVPVQPLPTHSPPLANTGLAAGLLLLIAVLLVAVGIRLARHRHRQGVTTMRRTTRSLRAASLASALLLCLSGAALAQTETTVTVSVGAGTRQLAVTHLTGAELTDLALQPGSPRAFRVRVTDTDYLTDRPFTVSATMGNLYRVNGPDDYNYAVKIPSSQVTVGFPADPLAVVGASVDVLPVYLLDTIDTLTCTGLPLLGGLSLPLVGLDLNDLGLSSDVRALCNALPAGGLTVDDLAAQGYGLTGLDLAGLLPGELPTSIAGGSPGAFTDANYSAGIGAGAAADPDFVSGQTGTPRTLLTGTPVAGISGDLLALITDALPPFTPITSTVDESGLTSTTEVIAALQADPVTNALGNQLALLPLADQVLLINSVFTAVLGDLGVSDLLNQAGQYHSFPSLTAAAGDAPAGSYAGTLTVTLVES